MAERKKREEEDRKLIEEGDAAEAVEIEFGKLVDRPNKTLQQKRKMKPVGWKSARSRARRLPQSWLGRNCRGEGSRVAIAVHS